MNVRQVIPRDDIPSVDEPVFGPDGSDPDDEALVVETDDSARAYPIRILNYHEIVNDVLDGEPLAVTWCPLCGSAVVYRRRVGDRTLTFGVSGKLADDDLVMYDRETESEWKQALGEAIAGPLEGTQLEVVPAPLTTLGRFAEEYPDSLVLQPPNEPSEAAGEGDDPQLADYEADPYRAYFEAENFGLGAHRGGVGRTWDRGDIDAKTVVLGIEADGEALGIPLPSLPEPGVLRTTVGERAAVVFRTGDGLFAYRDPGHGFEAAGAGQFRADGTTWDAVTGRSEDGRRLERVPARRLFAFAWQDDHGPDAFYTP